MSVAGLKETTRGSGAKGLLCATTISLSCQDLVISVAGVKSGHTSPQKENGVVRNTVKKTNCMINLFISGPATASCQAIWNRTGNSPPFVGKIYNNFIFYASIIFNKKIKF